MVFMQILVGLNYKYYCAPPLRGWLFVVLFCAVYFFGRHKKLTFCTEGIIRSGRKKNVWVISWEEVVSVSARKSFFLKDQNFIQIETVDSIKQFDFREWVISPSESNNIGKVTDETGVPMFEQLFLLFGHRMGKWEKSGFDANVKVVRLR